MKTKQCFKCKRYKEINSFYKHPQMKDGTLNKCKACNKKDVRENYRKRLDKYKLYERKRSQDPIRKIYVLNQARKRNKTFPGKKKARRLLQEALRKEIIRRPNICEKCQEMRKVQGHHVDYRRPLFVKWLCFQCHRKEHGQLTYEK